VDEKHIAALVLLDLSAAFDTVNHPTLLTLLQRRFGVCGSALQWFSSYLADRTQVFSMNGTETQPIPVQCSVPQGSVLGPVKFISYTEDVGSVCNQHGVRHHLYADDKQAYIDVPPQDIATARSILTNCIHDITNWCSSRRLQLNGAKTKLIWFGSRHTLQNVNHEDLKLQLGSAVTEPDRVVRDLGVLLDDELSMKQDITKVASTCFYQLRRLRQLRCLLGQEVTA